MRRQRSNRILAAAAYVLSVALIAWGMLSGDPLPILLGLVILAILFLTTNG